MTMSGPFDNTLYVNNYNTIPFPSDPLQPSLFLETPSGGSESITENRTALPAMCSPISLYGAWTKSQALELPDNPTPKEKLKRKSSRDSRGIAKRKTWASTAERASNSKVVFWIFMYEVVERVTVVCLIRGYATR